MDFYTCPICNTQVAEDQREYHEMICNNAFREEEFMDMIPCEVCGQLVNYENYSEHFDEERAKEIAKWLHDHQEEVYLDELLEEGLSHEEASALIVEGFLMDAFREIKSEEVVSVMRTRLLVHLECLMNG